MEKLIELLNEYEKHNVVNWYERSNDEWVLTCRYIKENFLYYCEEATTIAISKYYGFIKWLVENNKIDTRNLPPIKINYDSPRYIQDDEEILLMLLSISNSPIKDLILYLK